MLISFAWHVWEVLLELAPWMLVGMLVAGLMHGLLPPGFIRRQLRGVPGVFKAVVLGVPLPLCSCGVIPAGLGLKKDGASDGSTLAFLISTPQTGVDSILVSASMLGWPFAIFKVFSATVTGLVGGLITEPLTAGATAQAPMAPAAERARPGVSGMVAHAVDVLQSIWRWLVFGVLISAAISTFAPENSLEITGAWGGLAAALLMLVISVPLYVCATASVPIAAALVANGMPAGAAIVFLMAGPATNVATIGAIYRGLGTRVLVIYLTTIIVGSLGFAMAFDWVLTTGAASVPEPHMHTTWWGVASAIVLLAGMAWFALDELRSWLFSMRSPSADAKEPVHLEVSGMTCGGCANKLKSALQKTDGVQAVEISLDPGSAVITASIPTDALRSVIRSVGFETP